MVDFVLDGLVGKADLEPGVYQLFTLGNASMPSGGPVAGATFTVPAPAAPGDPPAPTPAGDSPFLWPKTEADFRAAMLAECAAGRVALFDPRTDVTLTDTLVIPANGSGSTWGANGNFAKIGWDGGTGKPMIRVEGVNGLSGRGFWFEKFNMSGGFSDPNWAPADACLMLDAPLGDGGPLYKFTIRDIFVSSANYGVHLRGGVYEGALINVHAENNLLDGIFAEHTNIPGNAPGIISNLTILLPNSSRNLGAAVRTVNSTNIAFGSFINNGRGVVAPEGLRVGAFSNGENTGESLYELGSNGYGSLIIGNEGSTEGTVVARRFNGTTGLWEDVGLPMRYLLDGPAGILEEFNHMSTYGSALSLPDGTVRVRK